MFTRHQYVIDDIDELHDEFLMNDDELGMMND